MLDPERAASPVERSFFSGSPNDPDNLHLLCSGCNRSKGGKTMAEWRATQ